MRVQHISWSQVLPLPTPTSDTQLHQLQHHFSSVIRQLDNLIWSNLIINLIHLWTAEFKGLDHDDQDYVLMPMIWQAIGEVTYNAGKTIPAAFGFRVPNIASEKAHMIAETYSIWTPYIAPTLLKGQFRHQQYYKHFIQLVELLMVCF